MTAIVQMDLQSILESRIAIYIVLGLLFTLVAIVLLVQFRRRNEANSRTMEHLEGIRLEVQSINENAARLIELLSVLPSYKDNQSRIGSDIAELQTVCARTDLAIQTIPSATVAELSTFLQAQETSRREAKRESAERNRAQQEQARLDRSQARIEQVRRRYQEAVESEVCQISTLVADISEVLAVQSALTNGCVEAVKPYLALASDVKCATRTIEQLNPAIEETTEHAESSLDSLEQAICELDQRHRPAWCIALLDSARRSLSGNAPYKQLETLLGLEEISVTLGSELTDDKSLKPEVVESDGEGSNSVITDLVEVGYKHIKTGHVFKQPKVKVRFEG